MSDDPPEPIANHRWRRVRMTDLPARIAVETPPREGDVFRIDFRIEPDAEAAEGASVLPFPGGVESDDSGEGGER